MQRLRQSINTFFRSQQGSAMPMIGLGIMALVGSAGMAIDMGRVQVAQSRMSSALDAAGLAAGSTANSRDVTAEASKYFNANFPPGYMGTQLESLSVSGNGDMSVLLLQASGRVDTTFMRIFGVNSVAIQAQSQITRANTGMELVLVIDTTGSMAESAGGGVTKMQAAKTASASLLNILYGASTSIDNLWVGLVPFAQSVNVGTVRSNWTVPDTFNWGTTSWMGCVDARETANQDITDTPPTPPGGGQPDYRFPKYYWACHTSNNAWFGTNSSRNNCATSPSGSVRYKTGLGTSLGPNRSCSQAVTPLTATKTNVLNAVNTLQPDGNTHIVLGASWAWRMLSPRWRTLWGGEMNTDELPLDYNTPLMTKVVVLMTDGDNTISNTVDGAYGYLSDGRLGTTNSTNAVTQLNTRLTNVCTNMKNNGIIIYTVAFGTSISTTARNMLRACATRPEYYFYSPTGADLQNSFSEIGDSLANLRISQ